MSEFISDYNDGANYSDAVELTEFERGAWDVESALERFDHSNLAYMLVRNNKQLAMSYFFALEKELNKPVQYDFDSLNAVSHIWAKSEIK